MLSAGSEGHVQVFRVGEARPTSLRRTAILYQRCPDESGVDQCRRIGRMPHMLVSAGRVHLYTVLNQPLIG